MREIQRSALVAHTAQQMFELINDIESYPQFVPWCSAARIVSRSAEDIVATLAIQRGALQTEFTTRNRLEPHHRVGLELVNGPFREFTGQWLLTPIGSQGCKVELMLRFAFRNPLKAMVLEPLFQSAANTLVDAFVARARSCLTAS
jgi:ribosome-associated toxin RatA of RatAB toxin-antitoxin module